MASAVGDADADSDAGASVTAAPVTAGVVVGLAGEDGEAGATGGGG